MKNKLSIIIVNYNRYNLTKRCIESVIKTVKNIEYEIIVLDNCSLNNSYEELLKIYNDNQKITIINNHQNKGFGHGNNRAVEYSKYKNILLLNPDVVALGNSIELMLERLSRDDSIGVIGCKLLNEDMTTQYSCRRFLKFKDFLIARTPLKTIWSNKRIEKINKDYLMLDYNHEKEIDVDWLMGSCLMLRKEVFESVGGFSKEYFMYFEDVDLCYKLKKVELKVLYFPEVAMIHLHEQQSVKKINKLTFIHIESMYKFYKKLYFNNK